MLESSDVEMGADISFCAHPLQAEASTGRKGSSNGRNEGRRRFREPCDDGQQDDRA